VWGVLALKPCATKCWAERQRRPQTENNRYATKKERDNLKEEMKGGEGHSDTSS